VAHAWDLDHNLIDGAGVPDRTFNSRRAYVLWSGGLDSTALVYLLLTHGYEVCAGHVVLSNNVEQSMVETRAIERLTALFDRDFPGRFSCEQTMKTEVCNCYKDMRLTQPIIWVTAAAMAAKDCDVVAFGYVMYDCAISFLPEIAAAYEALVSFRRGIAPRIVFPFRKTMKEEIVQLLPEEYQVRITWCENPTKRGKVCGSCKPCRTMREECPTLYYKRAPHEKKPVEGSPKLTPKELKARKKTRKK